MALVNAATTIIDVTADVATISGASVDTANDGLLLYDASGTGAGKFKRITPAEASSLFGSNTSLIVSNSSGWASDLSSNPPSADGQQRNYRDNGTGEYAQYISQGGSWRYIHGLRVGTSSPASSITPLGVGERFIVRTVDSYGVPSMGSVTIWMSVWTTASSWVQIS